MSKYRLYRAMYDLEGKHCGNEYMGEVITCMDCKFSDVYQSDSKGATAMYCTALTFHRMVADDDFCSYGKRREDDDNE